VFHTKSEVITNYLSFFFFFPFSLLPSPLSLPKSKVNSIGGGFEPLNNELSLGMQEMNLEISAENTIDQQFKRATEEDLDEMLSNAKKHAKELLPYDHDKMVGRKMRVSIVKQLTMLKDGSAKSKLDLGSLEIPFFEVQELKEIAKGGQATVRGKKKKEIPLHICSTEC
jgi:hypothetical protein